MTTPTYIGLVVGAGAIGVELEREPLRKKPASHAAALVANPNTRLGGFVDSNPEALARAQTLFPGTPIFTDLKDALATVHPDIVIIATPPASRLAIVELCCNAGVKYFICEKPLAGSVTEAEELKTLIERNEAILVLNYQRRFFPLFENARREIKAGVLGTIQHVSAAYTNGLYNNGGHTIDALLFLLEQPLLVRGSLARPGLAPTGDLNISALLETSSGTAISLVALDQSAYGIHEFIIYGTKGALVLSEYGYQKSNIPLAPSSFAGVSRLAYEKSSTTLGEESMVAGALTELLACISEHRQSRSGPENGVEVMRVLDAIHSML